MVRSLLHHHINLKLRPDITGFSRKLGIALLYLPFLLHLLFTAVSFLGLLDARSHLFLLCVLAMM